MMKILQLIHQRLTKAFFQRFRLQELQVLAALLGLYTLFYLPLGFYSGFLKLEIQSKWTTWIVVLISTFIMPGLNEEIIFRVLLIPHPSEQVASRSRWISIIVSWVLFLVYHPLNPLGVYIATGKFWSVRKIKVLKALYIENFNFRSPT
jgi:predicted Abi (CAAX) family protease